MKLLLAILVCRALTLIGRLVGKGTSLPGKYALKVCPDILSRIRKPEMIVAVTGSNGKTSTVEMIASVLKASGKTVAYNSEGSNQIEGRHDDDPQFLHAGRKNEAGRPAH